MFHGVECFSIPASHSRLRPVTNASISKSGRPANLPDLRSQRSGNFAFAAFPSEFFLTHPECSLGTLARSLEFSSKAERVFDIKRRRLTGKHVSSSGQQKGLTIFFKRQAGQFLRPRRAPAAFSSVSVTVVFHVRGFLRILGRSDLVAIYSRTTVILPPWSVRSPRKTG